MRRLAEFDLIGTIRELQQPVLGICLGMQILFERSAENSANGLGIVPGTVESLSAAPGRPVPHMGWNRVSALPGCELFGDVPDGAHFYFVHSFAAPSGPNTVASTTYGAEFSAAVAIDNFWGTQFHPERSGTHGAQVLANFLEMS
jgi:glutamine amidotransferase